MRSVGADMTGETKDIVLVTCAAWPTLSRSDSELADALRALGHRVSGRAWNDAPLTDFTSADAVVLRSNWDYHHDLEGFAAWLDQIDVSGVDLRNPAAPVRPYLDKSYLTNHLTNGFRTPRTLFTQDFDLDTVLAWTEDHGLDHLVVKPAWGASGHGVQLTRPDELTALRQHWHEDPARRPLLVQEFIPGVANGEVALVYFAGEFSHALLRQAADGDFRVNGGEVSALDDIDPALLEFGAKIEAALPERATYLRVDVVDDDGDPVIMEIEVNEPGLGLHLAPGSAARFANAILS